MDIDYDFPSRFDEKYGLLTRKLMRLLSEDARMSILELSGSSAYPEGLSGSALRTWKKISA